MKNGKEYPEKRGENVIVLSERRPSFRREQDSVAGRIATFKQRSTLVRRAMLAVPAWVTPNGVTVFRMLLVVPIVALLRAGSYWQALAVAALAMSLDFVDGALATARDQSTPLGAFLDPLADKVLVCCSLLALAEKMPAPFILLVAAICVIAALLTMTRLVKMAKNRGRIEERSIAAKPSGKLKLIAEAAGLLLLILGLAANVVWIQIAGGVALVFAVQFAVMSLFDQLFG